MSLQTTPAWESSGPVPLPDYQKRSRRWEFFRGRNVCSRLAVVRRNRIRVGVAVLSLAASAAIVTALLRPLRPANPSLTAALPSAPSAVAPVVKAAIKRDPTIKWKTVVATAYCPHCRVCETSGTTYTGRQAHPDGIAVARRGMRAARLGAKVLIPGRGWLLVDDVGGGVESNQIDIRVSTHTEAVQFGRQQMQVGIMETPRG